MIRPILPVALFALSPALAAAEPVVWRLQVSATAGAAIVAERDGEELVRLGCRADPAELFVLLPEPTNPGEPAILRLNELRVRMDPADGVAATELLIGHVEELSRLQGVGLAIGGGTEAAYRPPEPESAASLAEACLALSGLQREAMRWFLAVDDAGARLGYGAEGSEFVGPAFHCTPGSPIEISLAVPAGTAPVIHLRAGEAAAAVAATAEPDILSGGELLRGTLPPADAFWRSFAETGTVEAVDWTGQVQQFGSPDSLKVVEFLAACGAG